MPRPPPPGSPHKIGGYKPNSLRLKIISAVAIFLAIAAVMIILIFIYRMAV